MPKSKQFYKYKPQQLLVEGKDDRHVIWALCQQYQIPENFSVELPEGETEGVEALLSGLTNKLKALDIQTLGIVVDADQDLQARWQAVSDRLKTVGYQNIPKTPHPDGWVHTQSELPKIGVWLMPNNQITGILEDFVTYLIPNDDQLYPKANQILQEIEQAEINRYTPIQRPKALIHTWLAWQTKPGLPMGQAITAQVLRHNTNIAQTFVNWLNNLFGSEKL